jgi:ubiquinone/menaquinone biosynthesis C-methylase UbiE
MRNPEQYEVTLAKVLAQLRPEDRVLELGCGTGTTALRLAGAVRQYIASDYSPEMIAIATEKRTTFNAQTLEFCIGAPCDGSLPDGPFDVILGFNLLHLLPDRKSALAEIAQKLAPGGLFISKTPCLGGLYRVLQPVVGLLQMMGKAPQLRFVKPAELEREIIAAGFVVLDSGDYPKKPPSRFIIAKKT